MKSDLNLDSLPTVNSDDFLTPISIWTKLMGVSLVVTVGSLIALSSTVKYNVTVRSTAYVRPHGELRVIQSKIDGPVKKIEASENQTVTSGQVIAYIQDQELRLKKSQLQESIQALEAQIAQNQSQLATLDRQILAEFNAASRAIASAEADLLRVEREYRDKTLTSEADIQSAQASLEFALDERELYRSLINTGAVSEIQIREKNQAFLVAQAKLESALAVENPSVAPISIAAERIQQEQARGEVSLTLLEREQESIIQNQLQLEEKLKINQKDLEKVEAELDKYVIRSTSAGTILNLQLRNEGQVIRAGDIIANISPANTPLIIVAYIKDDDIGKVKIGQQVKLRVSAYPFPDFGTLEGEISSISPDTVSPKNQDGGAGTSSINSTQTAERYYEATILAEKDFFEKQGQQYSLQPGMEARADIISSEETVLSFLLRKARLIADF